MIHKNLSVLLINKNERERINTILNQFLKQDYT